MNYNLIVAICKGGGIGYKGKIPWHCKADLSHFSKLTRGIGTGGGENAVIMGSTTRTSLPHQFLPGRNNLILSSTLKIHTITSSGHIVKTFTSVEDISRFCNLMEYDQVWIIGGESIYKQFLDKKMINKCYISTIDNFYECDTFFPELNENEWTVSDTYTLSSDTYTLSSDTYTLSSEPKVEVIVYNNKN